MAATTGGAAPTLETVAAYAGVSRATVSRVINHSPKVSPEVRETVEAAIDELGYVPNRAARTLVTRRTDSLAMIIPERDAFFFADPYLTTMVTEVNRALDATELQLVLVMQGQSSATPARGRMERYVTSGHVDGVILVSVHEANPLPGILTAAGVPVVHGGRPASHPQIPYVDVDNVYGARQATEHLIALGRTRIATIAGPLDMTAGQDRLAGYREALAAARLPARAAHGDFTERSGFEAARRLLEGDTRLDAVFAASDLMALGALRALREAGRRVPHEVAVVGFDDLGVAESADPPLSSVRQPVEHVARELVRMLLARVDGAAVQSLTLPTTLTLRASA
ncbi:MAG: LacI family DNA-binding transcriptional regulator [Actinocrinis sp.]